MQNITITEADLLPSTNSDETADAEIIITDEDIENIEKAEKHERDCRTIHTIKNPERTTISTPEGKQLNVILGIPKPHSEDKETVYPPSEPYVCTVDKLFLTDKTHKGVCIENIKVIFCHGKKIANSDTGWVFETGQSVVETVNSYNKFAKRNEIPPIGVVASCNSPTHNIYPDIPHIEDVRVSEFQDKFVVHTTDEVMFGGIKILKDGTTQMYLETGTHNFFGLEEIQLLNQINISNDS